MRRLATEPARSAVSVVGASDAHPLDGTPLGQQTLLMNDSIPESELPAAFADRNPDEEWRTILRLSATLFGISVSVTCFLSMLFDTSVIDGEPHGQSDALAGLAVSIPLLTGLFVLRRSRGSLAQKLWNVPVELLGPALSRNSQAGLIAIALMAGIGEELLFRGLLQNWLAPAGLLMALIVPNIIFGLLHCVNAAYAVAAGVTGLYFSILLHFVPEVSLYSLMVAHAFYDYVALNCLAARVRNP